MNPQDPLANLQPLREPVMIGWWPPAPGWWVLAIVLVLLTTALTYWLYKRYQKNAYRRRALQQLQSLQTALQTDGDPRDYLSQINALLKSVALIAYPRQDVAAQHGDAWINFLNQNATSGTPFQPEFANAIYQKTCPEIDMEKVHQAAQHWVKHHRVTT